MHGDKYQVFAEAQVGKEVAGSKVVSVMRERGGWILTLWRCNCWDMD
jgi:hypothetical protein